VNARRYRERQKCRQNFHSEICSANRPKRTDLVVSI
jgi:hypothetical protein